MTAWPPPCEYGTCENPRDGGRPIVVDFGTAGRRPIYPCAPHRIALRDESRTTRRRKDPTRS